MIFVFGSLSNFTAVFQPLFSLYSVDLTLKKEGYILGADTLGV